MELKQELAPIQKVARMRPENLQKVKRAFPFVLRRGNAPTGLLKNVRKRKSRQEGALTQTPAAI